MLSHALTYDRRIKNFADEDLGLSSTKEQVRLAKDELERIYQTCTIRNQPDYELEEELVDGLPGFPGNYKVDRPVFLQCPRGVREYDRYDYFNNFGLIGDGVPYYISREQLWKAYCEGLQNNAPLHHGHVNFHYSNQVTVQAGNRRYSNLTEKQISAGLTVIQSIHQGWLGKYAKPEFYGRCVSPAVKDSPDLEPLEWAAQRLKIVFGFVVGMTGHDYAPATVENIYGRMAEIAANPSPESLKQPRTYQLTPKRKALLDAVSKLQPESLLPEAVIFLMENDLLIDPQDIEKEPIKGFLLNLPDALNNGLVIDRVSELALAHNQHGAIPKTAINHAVKIASSVYCSGQNGHMLEKPWYFKEDFDLRPNTVGYGWTGTERAQDEMIAAQGAYSYRDAKAIYYQRGYKLTELAGISRERAIKFTTAITSLYGLCHHERACHVIDFVLAYCEEAKPEDRMAALDKLEKLLVRQQPASPVIGILEGSDTSFEKPGFSSMAHSLLSIKRIEQDKVDDMTVTAQHIIDVVRETARPLIERAKIRPALAQDFSRIPLLTDHSDSEALALPLTKEHAVSLPIQQPLASWLTLQERFIEECKNNPDKAAEIYYLFCAHKMPEPFNPPPGFLGFIDEYITIRETDETNILFAHPNARASLRHTNTQLAVDRYMLISNLIDCWVIGITDWKQLDEVFDWVLARPTDQEVKEIQIELAWQKKERYDPLYPHAADFMERQEASHQFEIWEFHQKYRDSCLRNDGLNGWLKSELQKKQDELADTLRTNEDFRTAEIEENRSYLNTTPPVRDREARSQLESKIKEHVSNRRRERLAQLKETVESTKLVVGLATSGIVAPQALVNCFNGTVEALKKGIYLQKNFNRTSFIDSCNKRFTAFVADLHRLSEHEIIDRDAVNSALTYCATLDDVSELIEKLQRLPEIVESAKKTATQRSWNFDDHEVDPAKTAEKILENRRQLREELKAALQDEAFLAEKAADHLLAEFFWLDRYMAVLPRLSDFQRRVLPDQHSGDSTWNSNAGRTMLRSNNEVLSTWYLRRALRVFDSVEHPLLAEEHQPLARLPRLDSSRSTSIIPYSMDAKRQIQQAYEQVESDIERCRTAIAVAREASFGLLPIGGKIHVMHEMDPAHVAFLVTKLKLENSYFQLQHANKSLVLPPLPTSQEWKVVIDFLVAEGVINFDHPELQICLPGRLTPEKCPYLGAAILLSTERSKAYRKDAFVTTHNQETGYRIMAYDAGGARSELPFSTPILGRTDIFGRRHHNDIDRFQLWGTVLLYGQEHQQLGRLVGNKFKQLESKYCNRFEEILGDHGLAAVLKESWVNTRTGNLKDGERHFRKAVKVCTDAWEACSDACQESGVTAGIVPETRKMFDSLREEVAELQQAMRGMEVFTKQHKLLLTF